MRKNRYERTGEIVHIVIANYFRIAQKGTTQSAQALVYSARRLLVEDLRLARGQEAGATLSPGPRLLEFSNEPSRAEALYRDAEQRMIAALQNFADHPRYEKIRTVGRSAAAEIERLFKLSDLSGRVTGIVDCAAQPAGKPAVVDWKSGKASQGENDSLQLTAYALWGARRFGCAPENIAIYKAFLGSGTLIRFPLTHASVEKGKRRILQDLERMVEMHQYGVEGRRKAFTA